MPAPRVAGPARISRLVYAVDPPASTLAGGGGPVQLHAAVYINGVRQLTHKYRLSLRLRLLIWIGVCRVGM